MSGAGLLAAFFAGMFIFLLVAQLSGNMPKRLSKIKESKSRLTRNEKRQSWLNQSGVGVTPLQFWGISVGAGIASFSLLFVITNVFIIAAIPAIMIGVFPRMYFSRKREKLSDERIQAWPDALRTLVAGISSSQSLHQSLKALSTGGPVPLRPVFQKYARLTQALDQKSALEVVKEELADPMSDRIIEILISATEAGPGVVLDILRDLAESTTRDLQLHSHIETMQVEQKLNARIVFVMPYLLLVMMVTSSPIIRDFYREAIGIIVIMIGSAILIGGMLIIQKLGKIPIEQRVFTSSNADNGELVDDVENVNSKLGAF